MSRMFHALRLLGLMATMLAFSIELSPAQTSLATLHANKTTNGVELTWTGGGALQAAADITGPWTNLFEVPNPVRFTPSNAHQLFRIIQRWSTRAYLLDANSEMAVTELDGKIYVMGGYPASRVTVKTVQVYDTISNRLDLHHPVTHRGES